MFTGKILNLPQVPEVFIDQCWAVINQKEQPSHTINPYVLGDSHGRALYKDGKLHGHSSGFKIQAVSAEFDQWIRDNIIAKFHYAGVGSTTPGLDHCGPHRDQSRDYSLLYLLKSGGTTSSTQFWKERVPKIPQNYYDNYDELECLGSLNPKLYQWYILDAKCIHSVENVSEGRVSIQVSLLKDQVPNSWIQDSTC